ncbi:MAG: hypothetical protein JOZ78_25290 [Chroococcidiopsidaceae cyanobacterium CP_BM_ER_R8_30]|nr:hypothetical protein [Chroococcidiopsidaceae cyanobacterium CP_BM_ER_R8_30]
MSHSFTKAVGFPRHHRFKHSLGGPLIRVVGNIEKVFPSSDNHNGANHQHLILNNITVEYSEGMPSDLQVSDEIFVAVRFGDDEGLVDPVPFEAGKKTRIQGEYIDSAEAYPTADNPSRLPVLHFTHHPVGFVEFPVDNASPTLHYS